MRRRPVNDRYIHVLEAVTLAWASRRKVRLWYRSPRSGQVWHRSQAIDDLEDGGCLLTVRVAETREMILWIRSWGPDLEVLEPPALREEIAADAWRAAAVYGE